MPNELKEQASSATIIFGVAWFIWSLQIASAVALVAAPYFFPPEENQAYDGIVMVVVFLLVLASIEAGATVIIRRFGLIRPYQKGMYTPHRGPFRFLLVGLLNWFWSESIILYGVVVYFMSGLIWPVFLFGLLGLSLLLYHSPRLNPFLPDNR